MSFVVEFYLENVRNVSTFKRTLLILSFLLGLGGLIAETFKPVMLIFTIMPLIVNEAWWYYNGKLKSKALTIEATKIAGDVQQGTHGSMVSNNLAFFVTPGLLTMRSYEGAVVLAGYGLFRWISSNKEDGLAFKCKLLVWLGNVFGCGAGINLSSCTLQMSWERAGLGCVLSLLARTCYWQANKIGEPLKKEIVLPLREATIVVKVAEVNGKSPETPHTEPPSVSAS